jgi:hypothetical protein
MLRFRWLQSVECLFPLRGRWLTYAFLGFLIFALLFTNAQGRVVPPAPGAATFVQYVTIW